MSKSTDLFNKCKCEQKQIDNKNNSHKTMLLHKKVLPLRRLYEL